MDRARVIDLPVGLRKEGLDNGEGLGEPPTLEPSSGNTQRGVDLTELLVDNRTSTFLLEVQVRAMEDAGIAPGDQVLVDRSLPAKSGKIVIASLNGDLFIRRYHRQFNKIRLIPESNQLSAIEIDPLASDFFIWGVVTYIIKKL